MEKRVGSCTPTLANPPRDGPSTNHHCHDVIVKMTTTFDSNAFDRSLLRPMLVNTTQQSNIALVSLFLFTQSSLDNENNQAMAPGSVPFTKKCKGYKRMVEKLENGTIPPDMPPKEAYRSDPLFFQYSETAFKNQLKNWKNENGVGNRRPNLSTSAGVGTGKLIVVLLVTMPYYSKDINCSC